MIKHIYISLNWTVSHNLLLTNSVAVPQNELGICVVLVAKSNIITKMYEKNPKMCVNFNKYEHDLPNWITSSMLKSIEFRDNWYQHIKCVLKLVNTRNQNVT